MNIRKTMLIAAMIVFAALIASFSTAYIGFGIGSGSSRYGYYGSASYPYPSATYGSYYNQPSYGSSYNTGYYQSSQYNSYNRQPYAAMTFYGVQRGTFTPNTNMYQYGFAINENRAGFYRGYNGYKMFII